MFGVVSAGRNYKTACVMRHSKHVAAQTRVLVESWMVVLTGSLTVSPLRFL